MRKRVVFALLVILSTVLFLSTSVFCMEISARYGNPEKSMSLTAEPTDTVAALKTKIETDYQMSSAVLRLSFNGVSMEDGVMLQDYGIKEGCVLQIRFVAPSMSYGVQGIGGAGSGFLYFGINGGTPLSWRVLSTAADADATLWGQQDSLLLLSEGLVGYSDFSSLSQWNRLFYGSHFSTVEKGIVLSTKQETEKTLTAANGQVFSLSSAGVANTSYGLSDAKNRIALTLGADSKKADWWTSTDNHDGTAVVVKEDGSLGSAAIGDQKAVRAGLSLDKTKVLFSSMTEGGKSKEIKEGVALDAMSTDQLYNDTSWKLTLMDTENQTLSLGKVAKEGNLVSVEYSNAPIGPKQYISAIISDAQGSQILYYGKLKNTAGAAMETGTVSLTLPENFFTDHLRLQLFSEKCNGDKYTDYAGTLQTVTVTQNSAKKLSAFTVSQVEGAVSINEKAGTIKMSLAQGTDLRNLIPTFTASADAVVTVNDVVQVSGETVNDFSSPVTYTVTAENGSVKKYTVTASRPVSDDATLSSFWVDGAEIVPPFTQGVYNYAAKVSGNTANVTLTAIANDCRAVVSGDVGKKVLQQGFNEFLFDVTAENGNVNHYSLTIMRGTPTLNPFTDVNEEDWFYRDVLDAYAAGVLGGTSGTTYAPQENLSRAMAMVILYRLDGSPTTGGQLLYLDVPSGAWYSNAVIWAEARNITEGYEDGTFRPDDSVTREQLCTLLHRYAIYKGKDNSTYNQLSLFSDVGEISSWALKDVQWCVGNGYIRGTGDYSTLRPQDFTTRAEGIAAMIKTMDKKALGLE